MLSSRIFVRGLPTSAASEEIKKHFASQGTITDLKVFPKRRIAYIGYSNRDEAARAQKYFNKSFFNTSRVTVESADPIAPECKNDGSTKHSGHHTDRTGLGGRDRQAQHSRKREEASHATDDAQVSPKRRRVEIEAAPSISHEASNKNHGDQVNNRNFKNRLSPSMQQPERGRERSPAKNEKTESSMLLQSDGNAPQGEDMDDSAWIQARLNANLENQSESRPHADSDSLPTNSRLETEAGLQLASVTPAKGSSSAQLPHSRRLYLRNLPYAIGDDDIEAAFASFGHIQEVHVPRSLASGTGKGFAYVEFESEGDSQRAWEAMDGRDFHGRLLHILPAESKRETKLDDFAISQMPLKKQQMIRRRREMETSKFNWNSLYLNIDTVVSSVSDRLGVPKSELLDPTSTDSAVKQAQAETHLIQEVKAYFASHGVNLESFKHKRRGDLAILVKNLSYKTDPSELRQLFLQFGEISRFLIPPSGAVAIVEFASASQTKAAFAALAYRKFQDSVLYLEKAPSDVFESRKTQHVPPAQVVTDPSLRNQAKPEPMPEEEQVPTQATSTLYIRNLSFATTTEALVKQFSPLDGFISARVKTKTDPKKPGQTLSMGYGFAEFRSKAQAQAAMAVMESFNLDGHQIGVQLSRKETDYAEQRRQDDRAHSTSLRQRKLVVKNLPFEASKQDVRALLASYGQVKSIRVPKKGDRSSRGFAFAEFATAKEAAGALDALKDTHLLGRRLVIDYASADPEDAEIELERMQKKASDQINRVALHSLTEGGRKRFNVEGANDDSGQV